MMFGPRFRPSFVKRAAMLLGVALALSLPGQVQAKEVRIALMERPPAPGVSPGTSAWIQRFMRWSLRRQRGIKLMSQAQVKKVLLSRPKPKGNSARIRVFKRYLKKAKVLYGMTHFPIRRRCNYVLRALRVANKMASHVQYDLADLAPLRKLYLYYTLAYYGLQQRGKTRAYMMKLAQIDPSYNPSGKGFPASFVQYHRSMLSWLKQQPRYTMQLNTVPAGAKVYHNFRYKGRTPIALRGLLQGKHLIRLEQPGYKDWEQEATLTPKRLGTRRTIKATLKLKRDPAALSIDGVPIFAKDAAISDDILDKLSKITTRLNVKHLYIVEPRRTGKSYYLKMAQFKNGLRQIRYHTLLIGPNRASFRARITRFAKALARKYVPPPPIKPRRIRVTANLSGFKIYMNGIMKGELTGSGSSVLLRYMGRQKSVKVEFRANNPRVIPPRLIVRVRFRKGKYRYSVFRRFTPAPRDSRPDRTPITPPVRRRGPTVVTPNPPPRRGPNKVIARRGPRPPTPGPKAGTSFYETWWFWTAVIGGGIVATTAVVVLVNANGPPPSATLIITTNASTP